MRNSKIFRQQMNVLPQYTSDFQILDNRRIFDFEGHNMRTLCIRLRDGDVVVKLNPTALFYGTSDEAWIITPVPQLSHEKIHLLLKISLEPVCANKATQFG